MLVRARGDRRPRKIARTRWKWRMTYCSWSFHAARGKPKVGETRSPVMQKAKTVTCVRREPRQCHRTYIMCRLTSITRSPPRRSDLISQEWIADVASLSTSRESTTSIDKTTRIIYICILPTIFSNERAIICWVPEYASNKCSNNGWLKSLNTHINWFNLLNHYWFNLS